VVRYWKYIVIFVVLILAVTGYFIFFSELTPEQKIKKQLNTFLKCASKSPNDKLTTGLIKSKQLEKLFAPKCSFHVGVSMFSGNYTPEDISANSMRCRSMFKYVDFSVSDVEIEFPESSKATVNFTGVLSGLTKNGNNIQEFRELTCKLDLIEDKWLISSVSIQEIIKK
jgi:hypothetical protein